ncbi:MAG: efflux RND transporter permease subunit, partial [Sediminibacterium sp.]|nr:efflux RND transporter permease subunit [Sediminibacterium sp.]
LLVIGLIIQGIISFKHLKIDALPDITNVQVQIIAVVPALGASDVEKLITIPIEQANANIANIKEIRSFSRFGLAIVTVVFEENVDIFWARQQVAERINIVQKEIPPGLCTPTMGPISTGLGEIYQYVLRTEKGYENKFNLTDLRTIQDWIIRKKIIGIKGVADVSALGGDLKQYEIAVNNDKLKALGVDISEIISAVEKNNQNTGGTYIERGPTAQFIRTEGLVNNIEDIKQIVVKFKKRELPIFIRDVAEVKIGKSIKYGATTFNYSGEVVGAVVMMTKGENSSEVVKRIKKEVIEIQKILPKGVIIEPFLDRTKMINSTFSTIEGNLLEGCLIIVFILIIILSNFRAGIIVASMIPLSFLFAIIMMDIFDISANLMSLGALDFGLIVDGAIIILEAILFSLHNKLDYKSNGINQLELDVLIQSKANKMMRAAIFGQIIILIVYLPIFSFEGIEGKMFKPMAQTVAFALIGAFLLSITYIPTIASLILKKTADKKVHIGDKLMHFLEKHFKKILLFSFRKAGFIIGFIFVLFILSIYTLNNMGGEFIPTLEEGDFAVETKILTGSNLKTT